MKLEQAALNLLENRHGVGFREDLPEKLSFGENIENQRKTLGLTQAEAAKLVPVSSRTWERWESEKVTPPIATQAAVFKLLDEAMPQPSQRRRAKMRRAHHLFWDKHKGWFTRVTINLGPKVVGKRVKVRLYTKSEEEAMKRRQVVLATLRKLGLTVVARFQRGTGKRPPKVEGS